MSFDCKYNYPQIARDSGFKLCQCRHGFLDLRLIGSLDVEKIIREQQFEKIDDVLFLLSEAPLARALETNILDSGVGKYFFVSQLAIQYLIFCRKFLDESVTALRESLIKTEMEYERLKTLNQERSDEIVQLHKKISQLESINDIIFPCRICSKNFVSNDALNIHINKKHSTAPNGIQTSNNDKTLINTIKLELEIKHLKERLNNAEKDIRETSGKKQFARECTNISSSTQMTTKNVDTGTQCNLLETKEMDCSKNEKNTELFISQLQQKVLDLESHRFEEKDSMNEILKTLNQINETLRLKHDEDLHSLKKVFEESVLSLKSPEEIITTSTKKIQSFLLNTISDVMEQNSDKLNTILNKFEIKSGENKFCLQKAIPEKIIQTQSNVREILMGDLTDAEKPTNKVTDLHDHAKYNLEELLSSEKQLSESSHGMSARISSPSDYDDITNISIKRTSENFSAYYSTKDLLKQKLVSYGLIMDPKAISTVEASKILSHILENREIFQSNSKYISTRNKLESFINNLNLRSIHDKNVHERFLNVFKLRFMKKTIALKDDYTGRNSFNDRLETILSSPINKPLINSLSYKTQLNKPIPLPRKKVFIHVGLNWKTIILNVI